MDALAELLPLLLLAVLSDAREVHLPPGPLYRVEGTSVAIPCNVSEYEGPTLQHFEWFVYRPSAPDISIGMISTKDPKFPYAIFGPRVQAGNVSLQRVRGDSVVLHIKGIRVEDTGVYECYTPTTDSKYHGTYSSKVELQVIPDKLSVSAASPPPPKPPSHSRGATSASLLQVTLSESQDLRLVCAVASKTQQHTHLSVAFGLSTPEDSRGLRTLQEVIGVQRDFAVEAGGRFAERRRARELSLTKLDGQQYQMVLGWLRPEDSGIYHCIAGEWIQDPDGSWQQIAEKRVLLAQVAVQTLASQLAVSAGPPKVRIGSGEALELLCSVSGMQASASPHAVYLVGWEVSHGAGEEGHLVARLDADGAVVLGDSYANRDVGKRRVSLQKLGRSPPGSYQLRIESAQPGDVGAYRCVVWAFVCSPSAKLREVANARSEALTVDMKPEAVVLEATAWLPFPTIYRGDTAEVRCNISVESTQMVHLALSWWVEPLKEDSGSDGGMLASVSREGVADLRSRPSGGAVSVDKVGPLSHRLRIHGVQSSDEGRYHCAVTAWVRYPDLSWYKAGSVKSKSVTVYPYASAMDTLFLPLLVGVSSALFMGVTVLVTVTCCFMKRLRKR
ncbi:immunoglobulin superfamily member 8 [Rhineura floridana]|uniref:immunoglobulin superfamily member 8 n=1 Tax=Rhineura floridana TaxID=261503 RepID=UPI002AC7F919|nr:immunoglobulin superfamily member 8 [Rhineura floridana]